ncbi:adenylyl-sulfate kinase [Marinitoga sp. 38H-ov]|uniref:adenylyl-sulfate kinase n=1 Tax=Marinitoga sp. 38H-ov TaxID=1755814 RepID=UPI0013EBBD6C|nr:adenylyl-sulfate kinase [Marinitoga sp. 38H-ov]KAF2956273.1 adenylyl-sulfate kinase [Marinitoga sp. 38H-ov]
MQEKSPNVKWQHTKIRKEDREKVLKQKGFVLWFTGLSGSGKSTIAIEVEYILNSMGYATYLLDGDNIRHGLNKDLGFSVEDRKENIRRISEVACLFQDAGIITLATFISPFKKDRENIRKLIPENRFIEIYVKCSLETCEKRDIKGLYKKAREGIIKDFTGISSPYEEPENPEIIVNTDKETLEESINKIITYLKNHQLIR